MGNCEEPLDEPEPAAQMGASSPCRASGGLSVATCTITTSFTPASPSPADRALGESRAVMPRTTESPGNDPRVHDPDERGSNPQRVVCSHNTTRWIALQEKPREAWAAVTAVRGRP